MIRRKTKPKKHKKPISPSRIKRDLERWWKGTRFGGKLNLTVQDDGHVCTIIHTDRRRYHISTDGHFIMAGVWQHSPKDDQGGRDLHDGVHSRASWDKIMFEIVGWETVRTEGGKVETRKRVYLGKKI